MTTTRPSLGQIKEEGKNLAGVKGPSEHDDEENDVVPDELEAPKQRKVRDGKSRKRSVFSPVKGLHSERATFTLVSADQPSASQASQVSFATDVDYSNRRVSGQESHTMHQHGLRATYQIGPRNPFSVYQVEKIIKETFENAFIDDTEIRPKNALCKHLTEVIKMKTRRLNYDRYRIIVHVYICSKDNLTLKVTSRCVWDERYDNYADYTYEGKDFYIMGVVYGIYKE